VALHWVGPSSQSGSQEAQTHSSQNHRTLVVGRDLSGSSIPTPMPKQGHPEQGAQHRGQVGLEYLQRRRLHSPSGQPVPGLRHPQREEVLARVQLELPLLQFVPVAPCPVTGHHCKESGPVLLTPALQIFFSLMLPLTVPRLLPLHPTSKWRPISSAKDRDLC